MGSIIIMVGRVITSDACVAEGAAYLADLEPKFAYALEKTGPLPSRLRKDGFDAVLSAIVSQQISVSAAASIWKRLEEGGMTTPDAILAATDDELRSFGLSCPKVKYARALSESNIDFKALSMCPNWDVIETLIKVKGVGRWTAEIYAMFSLGRADVFAANDLALQEAVRILFELPDRPKEKELAEMAKAWSPWRAVAARLLFRYYHVVKDREGIRT